MRRLRFAVSEHLSGPPPYYYYYYYYYYHYYYSFPFRVFFPTSPTLPIDASHGFYAARADILTPRPPRSCRRRSAHPRRNRHTHSIGPKTDFIPHRAQPIRPTHHVRLYTYARDVYNVYIYIYISYHGATATDAVVDVVHPRLSSSFTLVFGVDSYCI